MPHTSLNFSFWELQAVREKLTGGPGSPGWPCGPRGPGSPYRNVFFKKALKYLYEKLYGHISLVGHLYRIYTTPFFIGSKEPVQRPAGFLLNPSAA